jgi:hypothetical protein
MGQRRTVQVWKFVVKGTVEEKMMRFIKNRASLSACSSKPEVPARGGRTGIAALAGNVTRDVVSSVKDEELDLFFSS